ncbi:response regulator [Thioalkalicoccus limnaeus]|uniref:Response regulator n=1 Tax=Thioalkalicoccus limnaeus TaxID=120681 RepID=A0ABV4BC42_9GAMM
MIRILLVDDHGLVRTGLRRILEQAGGIEVVGEAEDGASALRLAKQTRPDVVLMDLSMPAGMGGIEATRRLVRLVPGVRVIALTVMDEDPFPDRLREVGALGYLTKGCPAAELVDAVRSVARGGAYVESALAQKRMLADWSGSAVTPFAALSAREMQVAMMIVDGCRTETICETLSLSPKTVSTYRKRIHDKLHIKTDAELTRAAYRFGLIRDQL